MGLALLPFDLNSTVAEWERWKARRSFTLRRKTSSVTSRRSSFANLQANAPSCCSEQFLRSPVPGPPALISKAIAAAAWRPMREPTTAREMVVERQRTAADGWLPPIDADSAAPSVLSLRPSNSATWSSWEKNHARIHAQLVRPHAVELRLSLIRRTVPFHQTLSRHRGEHHRGARARTIAGRWPLPSWIPRTASKRPPPTPRSSHRPALREAWHRSADRGEELHHASKAPGLKAFSCAR